VNGSAFQNSLNGSSDVVKVILNVGRNMESTDPKWNEMIENPSYTKNILLQWTVVYSILTWMQNRQQLTIICSSFMLSYLDDPTINKFGNDAEKEKARKLLMEKGGLERLLMSLTGSGGNGKSFLLKASKSFVSNFADQLTNHLMTQSSLCQPQQIQQQYKLREIQFIH
jgi:hypothetical protein